jgi:hypothetical protein
LLAQEVEQWLKDSLYERARFVVEIAAFRESERVTLDGNLSPAASASAMRRISRQIRGPLTGLLIRLASGAGATDGCIATTPPRHSVSSPLASADA